MAPGPAERRVLQEGNTPISSEGQATSRPWECPSQDQYLGLGDLCVHRVLGLEDALHLLLGAEGRDHRPVSCLQASPCPPLHLRTSCHSLAQLLPALEEILRSHFRGLKKLVECDRQLHRHVLKGSPVPVSNTEVHWEESNVQKT